MIIASVSSCRWRAAAPPGWASAWAYWGRGRGWGAAPPRPSELPGQVSNKSSFTTFPSLVAVSQCPPSSPLPALSSKIAHNLQGPVAAGLPRPHSLLLWVRLLQIQTRWAGLLQIGDYVAKASLHTFTLLQARTLQPWAWNIYRDKVPSHWELNPAVPKA